MSNRAPWFVVALTTFVLFPDVSPARNAPDLVSVTPANAPTRGGTIITLRGTNFGARGDQSAVTFGGSAAQIENWADDQVIAITPEGDPGPVAIDLTTDALLTATTSAFRYDDPVLVNVDPTSAPAGGGVRLTITGENFGRAQTTRVWTVGGVLAEEVVHLGHERAEILMPTLTPGPQPIALTINGIPSNTIDVQATLTPVVDEVTPANAPTRGGVVITLRGTRFGVAPGNVELCGTSAVIDQWSDRQVEFFAPECFPQSTTGVITTAGTDPGQAEFVFAYDPTVITGIQPTSLPAAGGIKITIEGQNFGRANDPRTWTIDGAPTGGEEWRSHEEVVVDALPVLPGGETQLCVTTATGAIHCFGAPTQPVELFGVTPTSGPTSGGIQITIAGRNFGVDPTTPRTVTLGGIAAPNVRLVGDGRLFADLPAAQQDGAVEIAVTVANSGATLPAGFTYETTTGVEPMPSRFALYGPEPNPFSSRTTIAMDLPRATDYALTVYDVRGRMVRRVVDNAGPGRAVVAWNGTDAQGAPLASGVYFVRFEAAGFVQTQRMVLAR